MRLKLYAFDACTMPGSVSTNSVPVNSHTHHTRSLPDKDASLLAVSELVNKRWADASAMVLAWKTQADFANDVAAFKEQLKGRNTVGGKRSQQTQELERLDRQIEDALPYVKAYIIEKFGPPNAKAHYAEFGIVHRGSSYELPLDRQRRKDTLRMMADAIAANGFDTKQYGTTWWTDIKIRYEAALAAATEGAGIVSGSVSELVTLRATIRRVLHSILLLLEANYPDTFESVRRAWGLSERDVLMG